MDAASPSLGSASNLIWDQRWMVLGGACGYVYLFHGGFSLFLEFAWLYVPAILIWCLGKLIQFWVWQKWEQMETDPLITGEEDDVASIVASDGDQDHALSELESDQEATLIDAALQQGSGVKAEFLKDCEFLRLIKDPKCLQFLLSRVRVREFQCGEFAVRRGAKRDAFLLVKRGEFEIFHARHHDQKDQALADGDTEGDGHTGPAQAMTLHKGETVAGFLFVLASIIAGDTTVRHESSVRCVSAKGGEIYELSAEEAILPALAYFPTAVFLLVRHLLARMIIVVSTLHKYFGLSNDLLHTGEVSDVGVNLAKLFRDVEAAQQGTRPDSATSGAKEAPAEDEDEDSASGTTSTKSETTLSEIKKVPPVSWTKGIEKDKDAQKILTARLGLPSTDCVNGEKVRFLDKEAGQIVTEMIVTGGGTISSGPKNATALAILLQGQVDSFFPRPRREQRRFVSASASSNGDPVSTDPANNYPDTNRAQNDQQPPSLPVSALNAYDEEESGLRSTGPRSMDLPTSVFATLFPSHNARSPAVDVVADPNTISSAGVRVDEQEVVSSSTQQPRSGRSGTVDERGSMFSAHSAADGSNPGVVSGLPHSGRAAYAITVPGELLGVLAVLAGIPQYSQYRCRTACRFVLIDRDEVDRLLQRYPLQMSLNLLQTVIPKVKPSVRRIEAAVESRLVTGGRQLFREGESSAQGFYIVSSGKLWLVPERQLGIYRSSHTAASGGGARSGSTSSPSKTAIHHQQAYETSGPPPRSGNRIIANSEKKYQPRFQLYDKKPKYLEPSQYELVRKGGICGESECFSRLPYNNTAYAARDSHVVRISRTLLQILSQEHPHCILNFTTYLLSKDQSKKLEQRTNHSAAANVAAQQLGDGDDFRTSYNFASVSGPVSGMSPASSTNRLRRSSSDALETESPSRVRKRSLSTDEELSPGGHGDEPATSHGRASIAARLTGARQNLTRFIPFQTVLQNVTKNTQNLKAQIEDRVTKRLKSIVHRGSRLVFDETAEDQDRRATTASGASSAVVPPAAIPGAKAKASTPGSALPRITSGSNLTRQSSLDEADLGHDPGMQSPPAGVGVSQGSKATGATSSTASLDSLGGGDENNNLFAHHGNKNVAQGPTPASSSLGARAPNGWHGKPWTGRDTGTASGTTKQPGVCAWPHMQSICLIPGDSATREMCGAQLQKSIGKLRPTHRLTGFDDVRLAMATGSSTSGSRGARAPRPRPVFDQGSLIVDNVTTESTANFLPDDIDGNVTPPHAKAHDQDSSLFTASTTDTDSNRNGATGGGSTSPTKRGHRQEQATAMRNKTKDAADQAQMNKRIGKQLLARTLGDLEDRSDCVLYVADATPSEWTRVCLRQADLVLICVLVRKDDVSPNPRLGTAEMYALKYTKRHVPLEFVLVHEDEQAHLAALEELVTGHGGAATSSATGPGAQPAGTGSADHQDENHPSIDCAKMDKEPKKLAVFQEETADGMQQLGENTKAKALNINPLFDERGDPSSRRAPNVAAEPKGEAGAAATSALTAENLKLQLENFATELYIQSDHRADGGFGAGQLDRFAFGSRRDMLAPGMRNAVKAQVEKKLKLLKNIRGRFSTRHYLKVRIQKLRQYQNTSMRRCHHARLGAKTLAHDLDRCARILHNRAVGVILGGGGAKGHAHFGVLQALLELDVPVDIICGTSMGSMAAGIYALYPDFDICLNKAKWLFATQFTRTKMYSDLTWPILSYFSGAFHNNLLKSTFARVHLEDLLVPFACSSLDILNCEPVIHRDGELWRAVRASMSLVGFVPPFPGDRDADGNVTSLLVDGCYSNNFPIQTARDLGAGVVLTVDVAALYDHFDPNYGDTCSGWKMLWHKWFGSKSDTDPATPQPPTSSMVQDRVLNMANVQIYKDFFRFVDLSLRPPIDTYNLLDFDKFDELKTLGYHYAFPLLEDFLENTRKGQVLQAILADDQEAEHEGALAEAGATFFQASGGDMRSSKAGPRSDGTTAQPRSALSAHESSANEQDRANRTFEEDHYTGQARRTRNMSRQENISVPQALGIQCRASYRDWRRRSMRQLRSSFAVKAGTTNPSDEAETELREKKNL
ncbi:unnamed protein product [Amoebophrya sp. A120]|nr:unnamed protein product [Amoebophrya sp. A120]|eukprot:GSA120T00018442001.1